VIVVDGAVYYSIIMDKVLASNVRGPGCQEMIQIELELNYCARVIDKAESFAV
jgi:hypothetical protein